MIFKKQMKNSLQRLVSQAKGMKGHSLEIGKTNEINKIKWLKETLLKIPNGNKILDAGAGELQFKPFCKHLKYVSQDFGKYDGLGDQTGIQMKKWDNSKLDIISDITSIPVESESFDAVMCIEVLEHVPDPILALNELHRLLKPNGYLIITAPFCSITHFSPFHFSSGFNKYFYKTFLEKNNYQIIEITPNGNFFDFLSQELRRVNDVTDKYTSYELNEMDNVLLDELLILFDKISKNDTKSSELLCYGYFVFARKLA